MKKLLTFISSFSLISGVGITAVSCSSVQRFKDVSITDELAKLFMVYKMILTLILTMVIYSIKI